MTFTGRATRQGNTDRFGVGAPGGFTRACSPLGNMLYVFLGDGIVEITDLANGSGTLTNYSGIPSGSDIGGAFEFGGVLYLTVRGATDSLRSVNVSTGATTHVANLGAEMGACATDGTSVWAYDSAQNKLFQFNTTDWSLTEIADVTFESGVSEGGVQGMFYWSREGRLYIVGGHTDRLFRLPRFADNPTTWLAESVDATVTSWGVTQAGVAGATVFNGEAYMIGGNPDALYQFERTVAPPGIAMVAEQNILVNTDYCLTVAVDGDPSAVTAEGDMDGFDYDVADDKSSIKIMGRSDELYSSKRWLIKATFDSLPQPLEREVSFNVVAAPPVISVPTRQLFFRNVRHRVSYPVANSPLQGSGYSPLMGLKARIAGDNLDIFGKISADSDFNLTTGNMNLRASNSGGVHTPVVPFDLLPEPNLWVGDWGGAPLNPLNIFRMLKNAANNEIAPYFGLGVSATDVDGEEGTALCTGMAVERDANDNITVRVLLGVHRRITTPNWKRVVSFSFNNYQENQLIMEGEGQVYQAITGSGVLTHFALHGLAKALNSNLIGVLGDFIYYMIEPINRRVLATVMGSGTNPFTVQTRGGQFSSIYSRMRDLDIDTNGDVYIVELQQRRVLVVRETGNNSLVSSSPSPFRYFRLPSVIAAPGGISVSGDNVYIVDFLDSDEDLTTSDEGLGQNERRKVFVMSKNTAHNTTATITRTILLDPEIHYPQAIYVE